MSAALILTLALLGAGGGFVSGLLGVGGGVVMFPLLYYVPPLFGLERLHAQTTAAMVICQVFFSALIGGMAHLRSGRVRGSIAGVAGTVSAFGSFSGGMASKWSSEQFLLILFGVVTILVMLMMFLPGRQNILEEKSVERISVPTIPLALSSFTTGVVVGFLGAANFVFVPLLIYVFKVPTRIAIGSTLFIALMNTAMGFIGKLVTGQIPLLLASVVVCGSTIGVLVGEAVHGHVSTKVLRFIYAAMVALIAVRVWLTILGFDG